jgi:hypothetical protein
MSHWAFWILAAVLAVVVWLLGGVGAGATNGRGPGVTGRCGECGQPKKPKGWGGPL